MTQKKDRLHRKMEKAGQNNMRAAVAREEPKGVMIAIRVSAQEREDIKTAAKTYKLTVTEYLLRLHRFVQAQPREKEIATKSQPRRKKRGDSGEVP